jgi:hypothetical protein
LNANISSNKKYVKKIREEKYLNLRNVYLMTRTVNTLKL